MVGILPLMDEDQQLEADAEAMFDPATDIPDWYVDDAWEARVQAEIDAELEAMMRFLSGFAKPEPTGDPAMDDGVPF